MEIDILGAVLGWQLAEQVNHAVGAHLWSVFVNENSTAEVYELFEFVLATRRALTGGWPNRAVIGVPIYLGETLGDSEHFRESRKQLFVDEYALSFKWDERQRQRLAHENRSVQVVVVENLVGKGESALGETQVEQVEHDGDGLKDVFGEVRVVFELAVQRHQLAEPLDVVLLLALLVFRYLEQRPRL